jgi:type I restriction enzyme, S subunit
MSMVSNITLNEIMASKSGSVDPSKFLNETFDLYSISAYDAGQPEVAFGRQIGSAKQIVQPGDVLLSRIVPHIRRAWVVGDSRGRRIIASGEWIVFRSNRFHPSYLRHLLTTEPFYAQFMQTVAGVGGSLLRARPVQVADIEIRVPPISEQQRVSVQLEEADRLRRMCRYGLELSDKFLSAAFNSLFGSEAECLKRWQAARLDDCCHRITDGTHLTPKFLPAGVPFIFVKNVDNGSIDFKTDKFISEETHRELYRRCPVEPGDVLYTIVGATYGQAAQVGNFTRFAFQRHIAHLKPDGQVVLPPFLASLMQLPIVKTQADRWARGAAQPTINLKELKEFKIPVPPLPLQEKFAALVTRHERLHTLQRESLRQAEHLFQTLLHQAFSNDQ